MFKRILVPLDGSEQAEAAIDWVKKIAARDRPLVTLVRMAAWPVPQDAESVARSVEEARNYLQGMERELNYAGIPAKIIARSGAATPGILRVCEESRGDAIVMTARGGSKVTRWLVGGTAEQVMRLSEVPVLLVRGKSPRRIHRMLVPVDGSARAEAAIPALALIARQLKCAMLFLHVCPPGRKSNAYEAEFSRLLRRIVALSARLKRNGVRASFRAEVGDAAEHIVKASARAQMIAMTTHGRGGVKRWIFGSVAEKVVHAAPVPVLIWK